MLQVHSCANRANTGATICGLGDDGNRCVGLLIVRKKEVPQERLRCRGDGVGSVATMNMEHGGKEPSGANSNPGEGEDVVARVETSSGKTLSYLLPLLHKLLATAAVGILPGWVGSSGAGAGPHATDWVGFFMCA